MDVRSWRWRHVERNGVSNHRCLNFLLNRWFRRRSKKTSKLHVIGLCDGNSPVTGELPAQSAYYAENVSGWWRHRVHGVLRTSLQSLSMKVIGRIILVLLYDLKVRVIANHYFVRKYPCDTCYPQCSIRVIFAAICIQGVTLCPRLIGKTIPLYPELFCEMTSLYTLVRVNGYWREEYEKCGSNYDRRSWEFRGLHFKLTSIS